MGVTMWRFFSILVLIIMTGHISVFANQAMQLPVDSHQLIVKATRGDVHFAVEIADNAVAKQRGLMFRRNFPKDRAMLFVFDREDVIRMWMKNTPLPLDMLFVNGQGKIVSIYPQAQPFSEMTISSGYPAAYVVEINAGEVRRLGIKEGDDVVHPAICGACEAQEKAQSLQ